MCSTGTMCRALRQSGLKVNNWAVFPGGGGGVGIQGVQMAAAMGFRPIVIDTGNERQKLALDKGAAAFIDFKTSPDPVADVVEIADGIGAHGVFVTAGASYPDSIAYSGTRVGAVVTCIGLRESSYPPSVKRLTAYYSTEGRRHCRCRPREIYYPRAEHSGLCRWQP